MKEIRQIFANCKLFNSEGTQLYKDAVAMERVLEQLLGNTSSGEEWRLTQCLRTNTFSAQIYCTIYVSMILLGLSLLLWIWVEGVF